MSVFYYFGVLEELKERVQAEKDKIVERVMGGDLTPEQYYTNTGKVHGLGLSLDLIEVIKEEFDIHLREKSNREVLGES